MVCWGLSPQLLGDFHNFLKKKTILTPFESHFKYLAIIKNKVTKIWNTTERIELSCSFIPSLFAGQVQNKFKLVQIWVKFSKWLGYKRKGGLKPLLCLSSCATELMQCIFKVQFAVNPLTIVCLPCGGGAPASGDKGFGIGDNNEISSIKDFVT